MLRKKWFSKKGFFFLSGFSFTNIHESQGCRGRGGHFFTSSLLPYASQTLRHQPSDYCGEFTFAHSQQQHSRREPLASERKSLATKLRALHKNFKNFTRKHLYWSLFNKAAFLGACNFIKKRLRHRCLPYVCEICKTFKCNYFEEHLETSTFKLVLKRDSNTRAFL